METGGLFAYDRVMRIDNPHRWPGVLYRSLLLSAVVAASATGAAEVLTGWPEYGGGSGSRFSSLAQIAPDNVQQLELAWVHRSGDVPTRQQLDQGVEIAHEVTPITAGDKLVYCTPFNSVLALDPASGETLWRYNAEPAVHAQYANQMVCRGVAQWQGGRGGHCSSRIFTATNDARLIALDLETGSPCDGFGHGGIVDLGTGVGDREWPGEYQHTSPPVVAGDLVIVGGSIADGSRSDAPSGVVRAYDARGGKLAWAWDLAPPDFDHRRQPVSPAGYALGTPNVWAPMVVDQDRDLLFLATGNPAPDYFRGGEPDMDYYGSAVVALRASSGERVWHFKTVRNDFWDYDVASQPALADLQVDGHRVPALVQGTKMGFVFVLDRLTGQPLVKPQDREVPREGPLAQQLSPRQPVPPPAYRVAREVTGEEDAWGLTFWDRGQCAELLAESRLGPVFTPVTEQWTVVAPGNAGGINWGGVAVDAERGLIAARSSNIPFRVRLVSRAELDATGGGDFRGETARQRGQPWGMQREPLLSPLGLPCIAPPWGTLTAIDIAAGQQLWQVPHGTVRDISPVPLPLAWGVPGVGGPLLTASGLLIAGGAWEHAVRALDSRTGETLWQARLPAAPLATPMTYSVKEVDGRERQYLVIAAGGHSRMGAEPGDYLVAFRLP